MKYLNKKGFTLIELAITIAVIGLLLALGTAMIGPLMTGIKKRQTTENIGAAVESLNSSASGNNTLPNVAGFTDVAKSSQDAWGSALVYLYDANLYNVTPTKDTICGRKTTSLTLKTTDPVATIANVAYIVFSRGDDSTIQTTLNNTVAPQPAINPPTLNGLNFTSGNTIPLNTLGYVTGTVTLDANNSDIVRWVTLDELRTKVGCQGPQLRIVNNELPFGNSGASYPSAGTTLNFSIDGGATPGVYRWCIEAPSATPLPTGMNFSTTLPALPIMVTPANTCSALAETSWGAAASLTISTPPLTSPYGTVAIGMQNSYRFTIYVRDNNDSGGNNDNIASKPFVLTIHPQN